MKPSKDAWDKDTIGFEQAHPLGVRPSGNALVELDDPALARRSLGNLGVLSDELLAAVIEELLPSGRDLLALGHCSRGLFAYCWFDEFWKRVVYQLDPTTLTWKGSWRRTALNIDAEQEAKISVQGVVYSDFLHRPYELAQLDYSSVIRPDLGGEAAKILRLPEKEVTVERFDTELFHKPFITLLDTPIADWSFESLMKKFGNEVFRQEYMDWPLALYGAYAAENCDETPLYLFDCHSRAHSELSFSPPLPHVFGGSRDLLSLFGNERPDHQWLIIGPERSGSSFHKDPNATCAWNSLIAGHKYWIMFPPNCPPPGVWTDAKASEVTAPVSLAEWFASGLYKASLKTKRFLHAVTGPAEVMYVPSGWWHAVVNLDATIAMTGNFVTKSTLHRVLDFFEHKADQVSGFKDSEGVYERFVDRLRQHAPEEYAEFIKNRKRTWSEVAKVQERPFTFTFA